MSRSIIPSDEDVARLIAASCKKQSSLGGSTASDFSGLARKSSSELPNINKSFLQNTIRSVESHNRREEVDESWRQHNLSRKEVALPRDQQENDFEAVRRQWAKRKLDAIIGPAQGKADDHSSQTSSSDSSSSSSSDSESSAKKRKKHKTSSREKKEKKKKKAKKSKSSKSRKKDKKKHHKQ